MKMEKIFSKTRKKCAFFATLVRKNQPQKEETP